MATDYEVKGAYGGAFWIDLLGPAVAINPPGAASDPDRDPNSGWLLFDPGATELIFQQYQLPHGYVEGQLLGFEPHLHWQKPAGSPSAGKVAWSLRYKWANPGAIWTDWSAAITVTEAQFDDNTPGRHLLTSFGYITLADAKISANILCEISRLGGNGADTYAGDAALTDADAHVLVNQAGSVQTFAKYRNEVVWDRRT
jgi:hypothetical protein